MEILLIFLLFLFLHILYIHSFRSNCCWFLSFSLTIYICIWRDLSSKMNVCSIRNAILMISFYEYNSHSLNWDVISLFTIVKIGDHDLVADCCGWESIWTFVELRKKGNELIIEFLTGLKKLKFKFFVLKIQILEIRWEGKFNFQSSFK